ncbi:DUF4349 domain-containing protein [Polymorphospora lycopeni]|uniref:DUF4349 domain-containing protein n=1 Tax=Polymorphospora lycopeni TaxID=3140240 RepID=A0ABV5CJ93_9ACTN
MAVRRVGVVLTAVGVAAALALTGCSSTTESTADSAAPYHQQQSGQDDVAAAPEAGGGPGAGQPAAGAPVRFRIDERAIIYTGSITVRVDDVERAAGRATAIATGAGGFVGVDKRTSDDRRSTASLELRIPANRFGQVVDDLARLGDQEQRDISTQDVTEEALDLDARLASQRARVESGRQLLARATNLTELVMLESELAKREADLASLEAKKRRLDDLTALSTITLVLLGPEAERDGEELGFVQGLKGGWEMFVTSLLVLLTIVGALLPWLIVLGLPVAALVWLLRRRNRRPPVEPATVTAPPRS